MKTQPLQPLFVGEVMQDMEQVTNYQTLHADQPEEFLAISFIERGHN